MKKKTRKVLLMACAMVALVAITIGATVAYLTATDKVTNTFTVGKVAITLDEAKVDENGTVVTGDEAGRVQANTYKLMPGRTYTKDPTVHVADGSEPCWLFVKVENGIADIEDDGEDYTSITDQLANFEWEALTGVTNVYYNSYDGEREPDFGLFKSFTIKGDVDADILDDYLDDYKDAKVEITAYAVQADGFDTAAAAWEATFGATTTTTD